MTVATRARTSLSIDDVNDLEVSWLEADEALSVEDRLIAKVLTTAYYHDKVCQKLQHGMEVLLHAKPVDLVAEDIAGWLRMATQRLDVRLHDAATSRVKSNPLMALIRDHSIEEYLSSAEFDAFMFPIFEESGIGDRYESRSTWEVYPYPGIEKDAA